MGLFDDLFGEDKKKGNQANGYLNYLDRKDEDSVYSDEELDSYGLEEWEKEEVKKGNFDPWNFEEEELEDDDYYGEDE